MIFDENCIVPLPVNFNCWKHHAAFISNQIRILRNKRFSEALLKKLLLIVGKSQMDIYIGKLPVKDICNETVIKLKMSGHYSYYNFREWIIDQGEGYKMLKLSDKSIWTIRLGNQPKRYIHIHPGRNSINTIRVKALTLKTAIAFLIKSNPSSLSEANLDCVNSIRKNILDVPPLKSLSHSSGTGKVIRMLKRTRSE